MEARMKRCNNGDALSSLPDELLVRILAFTFSYKEAVKCSVLSKRWMNIHTKLTDVHFTESEIIGDNQSNSVSLKQRLRHRKDVISSIVSSALFHHKATVECFSLEVKDNMSFWSWCLDFMANYPLQYLTLWSLNATSRLQRFPFACKNLEYLSLTNVQVVPGPAQADFPSLLECYLTLPNYDKFWYSDFLPKCPVLYYLDFKAPLSSLYSPFTFSSPSLGSFGLFPRDCRHQQFGNAVEVRIEAPKLSQLFLDCREFSSKLKLKVESLGLQMITVEYPDDVTSERLPCIECHGTVWSDMLLPQIAKWNSSGDLTHLDAVSATKDGLLALNDLARYATVKSLKLLDFKIYPGRFWEMLCQLPLLQSLTLSDCTFEGADCDVPEEEGVDIQATNGTENDAYVGTKDSEIRESLLTEIIINMGTLSGDRMHGFSVSEKEMLQLFWEKPTYLKKLIVTLSKKEKVNEANGLTFFWNLISDGESVNLVKDDRFAVVFKLIRKNPKEDSPFAIASSMNSVNMF